MNKYEKFTVTTTEGISVEKKNDEYEFKVDKIVAYLKKYNENLPNLYTWNPSIDKLIDLDVLNEKDVEELYEIQGYEKEIILKEKIREKLNYFFSINNTDFDNLCLWIIKDWGGITGAKDKDTIELVHNFLKEKNPSFNRIASSSKVGSYMYPEKFIIYDSRVAYSLNWIILSESAGLKFFPIPEGRNSKMVAFDMNVLIRLKNVNNYRAKSIDQLNNKRYISNIDKDLYIPKKKAYTTLNKLVKDINNKLWDDYEKSKRLYYTEMLLFSIADKEIFDDITSKLSLNIK